MRAASGTSRFSAAERHQSYVPSGEEFTTADGAVATELTGDDRRLVFIDSLHGSHKPRLRFQSRQRLAQGWQIRMPETFPFQRNRPRELILGQQVDDLSQRHLAVAGQNVRVRMPPRGFGDAVFDMNVTNPRGKLRPRFVRGFAAKPPGVMRIPDQTDRFLQPGQ